ncbi:CPBP family intramembrane glutamic endopeptidase [Butyrivibrio sp. WCE2006]|uniref:CPBP family intramembrane glutamic endopeptidase n=1 Tax=Butyrivibrio sp. WCE2006 TaxID=1410611 RepID=UPI0006796B1E|nr:CPBP family intramembrane glutamic endopeptidase [Butyrivibrio sp. WCE2006]
MSVKNKFSHLGLSIVFYLVFSNILATIVMFIGMFIYAFFATFKASQAALASGIAINPQIMQSAIIEFRNNATLTNLLTMLAGYFIAIPCTILVLNSPRFRDIPALTGFKFSTPYEKSMQRSLKLSELLSFILFMFPMGIIGSLIGSGLASVLSVLSGVTMDDYLSEMLVNMPLPAVLLLSVILAPIFEEILFRYAVIGYSRRYGEWNAIIISALIFGLIHTNIFQFFYAFFLGIMLGYVYIYTRKLIYTIIMHVTFNFFGAFVPILINPNLSEVTTGNIIYSSIQYIVAFVGLILLIRFVRKGNILRTSESAPIQENISKDALLNPGMIILFIVCIALTAFIMVFA